MNKYGTASLIRQEFQVENIKCDTEGRAIVFDINEITFTNFYLHSGNDRIMRQNRDRYLSEIIPQLLINKKSSGILSADFNCIIDRKDALRNPDQKISPSLRHLVNVFSLSDSFRMLYPDAQIFSRYYRSEEYGDGATRIDRIYNYGDIDVKDAKYVGASFSDHHGLIIKFSSSKSFSKLLPPKKQNRFKANPNVVKDSEFKNRLRKNFEEWEK